MSHNLRLGILCLVNQQATSITLWDNTGVGDGTNFPYGWQPEAGGQNTQNPKKSVVSAIEISLTYRNGTERTYTLTPEEKAAYLLPGQGVNLTAAKFGIPEANFPDGIVTIQVIISGGATIGDTLPANQWGANNAIKEAFVTFIRNQIRNWSVNIPIPVKNLDDIFDQAMANLVLDNIYYSVQFGQEDSAQESMDFLIELVDSGKTFTDFVNTHNI